MININIIKDHVISMLTARLSKTLFYHNIHHTMDVTEQCLTIAREEGITDLQELQDLEIASLYHDTGFIYTYDGHEAKGCEIAREELPGFGVAEKRIDAVCRLIMATKIPQKPRSHLQRIICDADLDYLGRQDFYETGNNLRLELIAYNLITDNHDWEERQLDFLKTHRYFTKISLQKREPFKKEYIRQLVQLKASTTK
jgi:uncharacterized protein